MTPLARYNPWRAEELARSPAASDALHELELGHDQLDRAGIDFRPRTIENAHDLIAMADSASTTAPEGSLARELAQVREAIDARLRAHEQLRRRLLARTPINLRRLVRRQLDRLPQEFQLTQGEQLLTTFERHGSDGFAAPRRPDQKSPRGARAGRG